MEDYTEAFELENRVTDLCVKTPFDPRLTEVTWPVFVLFEKPADLGVFCG